MGLDKYFEDCLYNCFDISVFESQKKALIFLIIVRNSNNSHLEQSKIVYKGPYFNENFLRHKIILATFVKISKRVNRF